MKRMKRWIKVNTFCPTGQGGGIDPTCSPKGTDTAFNIEPARYAEGKVAVRVESNQGFKTRAARVAEGSGGKWSNREKAYIMSVSASVKMKKRYESGEDWSPITKKWSTKSSREEKWKQEADKAISDAYGASISKNSR